MRVAVLMAAGGSRRFGRADKLLAPLWGRPLLEWALDCARVAPAVRLIVAVPRKGPRSRHFDPRRVALVRVARPERGLAESLKAVVRALRPRERELFVFLADMPLVPHGLAATLARRGAVRPHHRGRPGHPVRIRVPDPASLAGDEGMRAMIGDTAVTIPAAAGCIVDVDDRAALMRLRLRPGRRPA